MDVINCKGCGRLFNALTRVRHCPNCQAKLEDKFQEVKKFINENPGSTIDIVSEECEVSAKQIKQWIREERLVLSNASEGEITCESCGVCITTGRYCDRCKAAVTNSLSGMYRPVQPTNEDGSKRARDKDRMRFLDSK